MEVTVKDLLKGVYDKACQQKLWGLVRHSAGIIMRPSYIPKQLKI